MSTAFDIIVLGAGMAGASVTAELAPHARVLLLETEDQPGRHSTGRSAAMFFESYGNATVRALTRASRAFLEAPPEGFAQVPLLSPRDALIVCGEAGALHLRELLDSASDTDAFGRIPTAEALRRVPILRPDWLVDAALDTSGRDMEVAAIHQGFLRTGKRLGAQIVVDAGEVQLQHRGGVWQVRCRAGEFQAPRIVNATGAWADAVARRAGVPTVGLQPLRRTAMLMPAPEGHDTRGWPMTAEASETVYFKPDAGQMLLSPANEDPSEPCDAAPDELDVAIAVDRFEAMTTVRVGKLNHRWAGLRSFVADRSPVVGYSPAAVGFFWLAGQGGYGIQMAPALARTAASLVLGHALPTDVAAEGVTAQDLAPDRPALQPAKAGLNNIGS